MSDRVYTIADLPGPPLGADENRLQSADANGAGAVERLEASRVDLLTLIDNGLPHRPRVPGSAILHKGKRHLFAAKAKSGKSLFALAHAVDIVAAGGCVAILDRENGAEEYARRLGSILAARNGTTRRAVAERLAYYAWPNLRLGDGCDGRFVDHLGGFDATVFDASRPWLSVLHLRENESDDYAKFMAAMVDPLAHKGTATVTLDNTGHDEQGRPRGSSSKLDLHDLTFSVAQRTPFDERTEGSLLITPGLCRFTPGGPWEMRIGGGVFGEAREPGGPDEDSKRLALVCELLGDGVPRSKNRIGDELRGSDGGWQRQAMLAQLSEWAADPSTPIVHIEGEGYALRG
jgi:hypothetical protein